MAATSREVQTSVRLSGSWTRSSRRRRGQPDLERGRARGRRDDPDLGWGRREQVGKQTVGLGLLAAEEGAGRGERVVEGVRRHGSRRRRPCLCQHSPAPTGTLVVSKKKRKLLPFNPSEDPARRLTQMASLATVLTATGAVFSNKLTYVPGMAPRSANRAALEDGGMQVLPKEDAETLNLCKRMMERGEWPPLLVVFDRIEGFTVEVDRFIKDQTIITEYVGDVDYLRNWEHDDGDSMMTLLSAKTVSKSLVICPDKRSNIARFINGINNHTPDGRTKQNLKCVRYDVDGECHVLLVANRDISKRGSAAEGRLLRRGGGSRGEPGEAGGAARAGGGGKDLKPRAPPSTRRRRHLLQNSVVEL